MSRCYVSVGYLWGILVSRHVGLPSYLDIPRAWDKALSLAAASHIGPSCPTSRLNRSDRYTCPSQKRPHGYGRSIPHSWVSNAERRTFPGKACLGGRRDAIRGRI